MKPLARLLVVVVACSVAYPSWGAHHKDGHDAPKNTLQPVFLKTGKVLIKEDFNRTKTLDKKVWSVGQHTTWEVGQGVLLGSPSTEEYQNSRPDHKGTIPRMRINLPSQDFVMAFSFKLFDPPAGKRRGQGLQAFFEFGHHLTRVNYNQEGTAVLVDHEKTKYWHKPDAMIEAEKWHHVLAELRGDELVVRFDGGPEMYVKHKDVAAEKAQFGIVGYNFGTIQIDNVTMWEAGEGTQRAWSSVKDKLVNGDGCGCGDDES